MRKGHLLTFFIISTIILGASHAYGRAYMYGFGPVDYAPKVRQISPVGMTVDLRGADGVLFKWSWIEGDRMQRQYYDFRVYKGYDTVESTLIYKEEVARDTDSVFLKSGMFDDGQTYTWTIRQRYYGMAKSVRSYASFRVIKK